MARLRALNSVDLNNRSSVSRNSSHPPLHSAEGQSPSPSSPTQSQSSDKENSAAQNMNKTLAQGATIALRNGGLGEHSSKRRRLRDHEDRRPHHAEEVLPMTQVEINEKEDLKYYDPDQDPEERRMVRKGFRELYRDTTDFKSKFMRSDNDDLHDTIRQQNELFSTVKQTNDACMDSRLLTTVSDLAYKKSQLAARGEGHGQGVDVDDFVSKCITFMRQGGESTAPTTSTQRARRRRANADVDDDEEEDEGDVGDGLNWAWLGAQVCFPVNSRPPAPSFLLGPLSVQKRVRSVRVRKERQKQGPVTEVRPEELKAADLERNEKSNLVSLCKSIHNQMNRTRAKASTQAQRQFASLPEDHSNEDVQKILSKNNLCDDEGLQLLKFALHPTSFGQTVENLFYISFLIRDNMVGIEMDGNGMISIQDARQREAQEIQNGKGKGKTGARQPGMRHQAIFSLDFETWQELVKVLNIKEPLIPDRSQEENTTQIGARGWYS